MAVDPRIAATVMLIRDAVMGDKQQGLEVFMVRRVVQSEFLPDVYVFPGGSVMEDDRVVEQDEQLCAPVASSPADVKGETSLGHGIRAAAIRELFEEANVLLAYHQGTLLAIDEDAATRFADYRRAFNEHRGSLVQLARSEQLILATDHLAYFAHWITPEGMPRRFDTYFFLAEAPVSQEALYDQLETSDGVWIQPAKALARHKDGSFPTAFPTYHQLQALAAFNSTREALASAARSTVPVHLPSVVQKDGRPYVYLPGEAQDNWRI